MTISQDYAALTTMFLDLALMRILINPNYRSNRYTSLNPNIKTELEKKIILVTVATSTVAIAILTLPLGRRCFKTSYTMPQKLRFTVQTLQLSAAVGRSYLLWNKNKVFSVGEVAFTLLQQIALHKQCHPLAALTSTALISNQILAAIIFTRNFGSYYA